VAPRRRALLRLDAHPIIDHFSVSFAASALVLALFTLLFPGLFRQPVTDLLRAFIGVLPLAVAASFVSGLFDGKVRFRRTATPLLRRKKVIGGLFFACAAAAAALTFLNGPLETWVSGADVALLAAAVVCAVSLGRIGGGLLQAIFPG
jgi:O-antigen/teichoic acid export membrane protein